MDDYITCGAECFGDVKKCRCRNSYPKIFFKKNQILVTCPYCGSYVCFDTSGVSDIDENIMRLRMVLHDWNDLQDTSLKRVFPALKRCTVEIIGLTDDIYGKTLTVEGYKPRDTYRKNFIQGINISLSDTIQLFINWYKKENPVSSKKEYTSEETINQITKSDDCVEKPNEGACKEKQILASEFSEECTKLRENLSHITEGFENLRKELHHIWESLQ